jgi:hypothetical protein
LHETVTQTTQGGHLRAASAWPAIRIEARQAFSLIPPPKSAHILAGWPPTHLAAIPPTEDGLRDLLSIVDEHQAAPEGVDPRDWETELSAGLARLGEAYPKRFFEEIRRNDRRSQPTVLWAIRLMKDVDAEDVVDILIEALGSESWVARWMAAEALIEHPHPRATDPLIEALGDRDDSVVSAAIGAVWRTGSKRALPALQRVAGDPRFESRPGIQASARRAAEKLGT